MGPRATAAVCGRVFGELTMHGRIVFVFCAFSLTSGIHFFLAGLYTFVLFAFVATVDKAPFFVWLLGLSGHRSGRVVIAHEIFLTRSKRTPASKSNDFRVWFDESGGSGAAFPGRFGDSVGPGRN